MTKAYFALCDLGFKVCRMIKGKQRMDFSVMSNAQIDGL